MEIPQASNIPNKPPSLDEIKEEEERLAGGPHARGNQNKFVPIEEVPALSADENSEENGGDGDKFADLPREYSENPPASVYDRESGEEPPAAEWETSPQKSPQNEEAESGIVSGRSLPPEELKNPEEPGISAGNADFGTSPKFSGINQGLSIKEKVGREASNSGRQGSRRNYGRKPPGTDPRSSSYRNPASM